MITREVIKCKCHKELVRTKIIKGKPFNKKEYRCDITGRQLYNDFIYEKVKINLRDPKEDETRDGSEAKCPEDIEKAYEDYKKKATGNGDDKD